MLSPRGITKKITLKKVEKKYRNLNVTVENIHLMKTKKIKKEEKKKDVRYRKEKFKWQT